MAYYNRFDIVEAHYWYCAAAPTSPDGNRAKRASGRPSAETSARPDRPRPRRFDMSHEITQTDGIAYNRTETPWHGIGAALDAETATLEEWRRAARMEWQIRATPVLYCPTNADRVPANTRQLHTANGEVVNICVSDKRQLYRSDTGDGLAVVSQRYKIVQPQDVLEFYRELVDGQGFTMETAGTLRGGRVFWALARTGQSASVNGDRHDAFVLLASSCDGSLSTVAQGTEVRVVCMNTLNWALETDEGQAVRVRHSTEWDPEAVKAQMGLTDWARSWGDHVKQLDRLAETPMSEAETATVYAEAVGDKGAMKAALQPATASGYAYTVSRRQNDLESLKADMDAAIEAAKAGRPTATASDIIDAGGRTLKALWRSFEQAPGQDSKAARGTAYGALQGATHFVDFDRRSKDQASRLNAAWFNSGAALKQRVEKALIERAA